MPWKWARRIVARNWQCFPWDVDEAPADEVQLELELHNLEAKYSRAKP